MPKYQVYQIEEEVIVHKHHFVVEADDDDEAIEMAMNGEVDPIKDRTIVEPGYTVWGWSARPADALDDKAWDEAKSDLEARRLE
jgi:hypothetical protein